MGRKYKYIQCRLKYGRDDVIINWIKNFGEGEKSVAIRHALRWFIEGNSANNIFMNTIPQNQSQNQETINHQDENSKIESGNENSIEFNGKDIDNNIDDKLNKIKDLF